MSSFVCFSQKGTDTSHNKKDSTICFPVKVAREIVKDLLRGDSCSAILESTKRELSELYDKVDLKDSVINSMKTKEDNYKSTIDLQSQKYNVLDEHTRKVELKLAGASIAKDIYKYGLYGSALMLVLTILTRK